LAAWLESQHRHDPEAELIVQNALGRMRMEIGLAEASHAVWLTRFDEPMRQRYRETGRQLLGLLLRFISSPDQQASTLAQAREIGQKYAVIARDNGLSLADAVRAVMFFHNSLTDSVVQIASSLGSADGVNWSSTHRQVTNFVNDVLVAMIEAYTGKPPA
jgi:hypothetical protein